MAAADVSTVVVVDAGAPAAVRVLPPPSPRAQRIAVTVADAPPIRTIRVRVPGERGPKGEKGDDGRDGLPANPVQMFQINGVSSFTAQHGLSYPPSCWLMNADNELCDTDISFGGGYVYLVFPAPFTGRLFLR